MRLRIPPALVFLLFIVFMYLLDAFFPVGEFDFFGRLALIWVLSICAMAILLISFFQFRKARTTVDPSLRVESTVLVTNGIYAFTRNPMYLSMLLLLLAWGLKLGNAFNTLLAALFVAYMNRFQIKAEEEQLERLFGKVYQQYCLQVRRWF